MQTTQYLGENLIFLISPPRSGSTLLQRIIGAHSEVYTVAEPWIMLHPIYSMRKSGITTEYNSQWAYSITNEYFDSVDEDKQIRLNAIRAYSSVLYNNVMNKRNERYFLDKTPRYYFIINELIELFPLARFIILRRNPLSILASILNTWIKDDYEKISLFKYDLVRSVKCLLEIGKFPAYYASITYEQYVSNPSLYLKNICEAINLPFEMEMLNYAQKPIFKGKSGDETNARKLRYISSDFKDKWQDILHLNPVYWHVANAYMEILGAQAFEALGYSYHDLKKQLCKKNYRLSSNEKIQSNVIINYLLDVLSDQDYCNATKNLHKAKLLDFSEMAYQPELQKQSNYSKRLTKSKVKYFESVLATDGALFSDTVKQAWLIAEDAILSNQGIRQYYHNGLKLHKAGYLNLASKVYQWVLHHQESGSDLAAWAAFKLGELCLESNDDETAHAYFAKAVEINPIHAKARIYLVDPNKPLRVFLGGMDSEDLIDVPMDPFDEELWKYYFTRRKPDYCRICIGDVNLIEDDPRLEKLLNQYLAVDGTVDFVDISS